jgi:hypothetical protein
MTLTAVFRPKNYVIRQRRSDMNDGSNHHGILNEHTGTIHKQEDADRLKAQCGALRQVPSQHLQPVLVDDVVPQDEVDRCGRCFDDGGGY